MVRIQEGRGVKASGYGTDASEVGRREEIHVSLKRAVCVVVLLGSLAACSAGSTSSDQTVKDIAAAQDKSAQSDLTNALIAAKIVYSASASYAQADSSPTGLVTAEAMLCYVGANTPSMAAAPICQSGQGDASLSIAASTNAWSAARMSVSGRCFWIRDDTTGGTKFGSGTPCTGVAAAGASSSAFPT
jgi:hypothetical protein